MHLHSKFSFWSKHICCNRRVHVYPAGLHRINARVKQSLVLLLTFCSPCNWFTILYFFNPEQLLNTSSVYDFPFFSRGCRKSAIQREVFFSNILNQSQIIESEIFRLTHPKVNHVNSQLISSISSEISSWQIQYILHIATIHLPYSSSLPLLLLEFIRSIRLEWLYRWQSREFRWTAPGRESTLT